MKNKSTSIIDLKTKPLPAHAAEQPADVSAGTPLSSGWERFWLAPADPIGLNALRFLAGLVFLSFLLPLAGQIDAFFSLDGWFDRQAFVEAGRLPLDRRPMFGWSLLYVFGTSSGLAHAFFWSTIGVLVFFTLGLATRIVGVLTWVLIISYVSFGPIGFSEMDLLVIFAFYFMLAYLFLGQYCRPLSAAERVLGPWDSFVLSPLFFRKTHNEPIYRSYSANLFVRLMQVHFAILVVASCFSKLQIGDWWSGYALWYPLHQPFETTPEMIHKEANFATTWLFIYSLAQYLMLAWQITFPLWAWKRRFRVVLLVGGALAFVGCIWIYRTPVFGAIWLLGCLLFLTPAEWRRVTERLQGGWQHFTGGFSAKRDEKVSMAVRS